MKKLTITTLAGVACALLLGVPVLAANKPMAASKTTMKSATERSAWPPETLTGKITTVDPDQKLVVVQDKDGVPFDLVVTAKTRILSGDQKLTLNDLKQDQQKQVSVKFVPRRNGDVAQAIRING